MTHKVCTKCKIDKPLSDFTRNVKSLDCLNHWCRACWSNYQKKLYTERAAALFERQGGKCEHCGLRDLEHPEIYEYHHINPATKVRTVSYFITGSPEKLHAEAAKCLLLCSNCHKIEHGRLRREQNEV